MKLIKSATIVAILAAIIYFCWGWYLIAFIVGANVGALIGVGFLCSIELKKVKKVVEALSVEEIDEILDGTKPLSISRGLIGDLAIDYVKMHKKQR